MIDYVLLFGAFPAGVYAYTYAKSLREDGNTAGAALVLFLIAVSIGLPIYRMLRS